MGRLVGGALSGHGRLTGGGDRAAGHIDRDRDIDPENLAVPVGVDASGDHDRDVEHPAVLTDLSGEGVGGHEGVGVGVQGRVRNTATWTTG